MLTVEEFKTDPGGYDNWYVLYRLIGKELTPEKVVDMLNSLYPDADRICICDGILTHGENNYNMVSFTIGKGEQDDIIKMTAMLDCIGYVESPWHCRPPRGYKSGKEYLHCYVECDECGTPYDGIEYEEDTPEEDMEWDCSVIIYDDASDISFGSGGGCESYETMLAYQDFIGEHEKG